MEKKDLRRDIGHSIAENLRKAFKHFAVLVIVDYNKDIDRYTACIKCRDIHNENNPSVEKFVFLYLKNILDLETVYIREDVTGIRRFVVDNIDEKQVKQIVKTCHQESC